MYVPVLSRYMHQGALTTLLIRQETIQVGIVLLDVKYVLVVQPSVVVLIKNYIQVSFEIHLLIDTQVYK